MVKKWFGMGHAVKSQKGHDGMPVGMPFYDVACLESGH